MIISVLYYTVSTLYSVGKDNSCIKGCITLKFGKRVKAQNYILL